ncbi:hypothetical protein Hanom_Chr04g00301561 [Helianthus anomalus]
MRKNKPLGESRKTGQTSGTKMEFYSKNSKEEGKVLKLLTSSSESDFACSFSTTFLPLPRFFPASFFFELLLLADNLSGLFSESLSSSSSTVILLFSPFLTDIFSGSASESLSSAFTSTFLPVCLASTFLPDCFDFLPDCFVDFDFDFGSDFFRGFASESLVASPSSDSFMVSGSLTSFAITAFFPAPFVRPTFFTRVSSSGGSSPFDGDVVSSSCTTFFFLDRTGLSSGTLLL